MKLSKNNNFGGSAMKHKLLYGILAVEAVLLVLLGIWGVGVVSITAFPFAEIGCGLRALSLSGGAGNSAAVILYGLFCLLPLVYLLVRMIRRRARAEDGLLGLLSALMFWILYLLINPAEIGQLFGAPELAELGVLILGGTLWSILIGYAVLRALRTFSGSHTVALLRYLDILLGLLCVVLVYGVFGSGFSGLLTAFEKLKEANTGAASLGTSYLFLVLQYLADVLPYMLDLVVIQFGMRLTDALRTDVYGPEVGTAANRLGAVCQVSVVAVLLMQIAVNVSQLLLGSAVHSSDYTVRIPLLSIVFVLAVLLLAKYFAAGRQLKKDNDMFI
jgi:hypothetical protein